jgi:hypothetical protein
VFDRDIVDPVAVLSQIGGLFSSTASGEIIRDVQNGREIDDSYLDNPPGCDGEVIITDRSGAMAAIIEKRGEKCRYRLVVPR